MTESSELPTLIANRYVVEAQIGRGGMAVVARVLDRATGERVALKQLLTRGASAASERARMLFELECQTLALLKHPRIVRVLDYGVDNDVPYYTMELLDGGDLSERAPLHWREACTIGRDICSALSLLHARRMVYRDLSPRNVRCTSDGMAKLIDFGAMAPMGSVEFAVCTPAAAAPEVVNLQPLDARADLYALGSVLYQTLTGRAPYPAANFHMLPMLWQQPLAPPSAYVDGLPEALDNLVMELLKLDAQRRPASAAEVSERLCAIAGVGRDEQLVESQAYLTTPDLVGRNAELQSVQTCISRLAADRRGAALLLLGASGAGRSRLLDASISMAKLEGLTVLRVGGGDGAGRRLELVHRFAEQLASSLPDVASCAPDDAWPVLSQLVPSLRRLAPDRPAAPVSSADVQSQTLSALRAWLLAVANQHPLFIGVDDIERLDVESRNLIALLAERAIHQPLLVVVARCEDLELDCDAVRLLEAKSATIKARALDAAQVGALFESVFGSMPHLRVLTNRLHELANGNPRRLMQLAQHLVEQGVVRHQRGAWTLLENATDIGLPQSMAEATVAIVDRLSKPARELAQAIALGGVDQHFELANILQLSGSAPISMRAPALSDSAQTRPSSLFPANTNSVPPVRIADAAGRDELLANLTELTSATVLVSVAGTYRLRGSEWIEPLLSGMATRRERAVHAQLSEIFAQRGDGPRQAFHLIRAGRPLDGVSVLARYADDSCAATDVDPDAYLRFLEDTPDNWRAIYGEALALAVDHPRRKHVEYAIRTRLLGFLAHSSGSSDGHFEALMNALAEDAGIDILASLDPSLPPADRLKQAIGQAFARHQLRPESEQVVDPLAALQRLARAVTTASGHVANSMDLDTWRRLPSLQPVAALSPALGVVSLLADGADARLIGRFGESQRIFVELLELLAPPNDRGLAPSYAQGIRVGVGTVVGLYTALLGDKAWEGWAAEVSIDPIHATNALLVRALGELWQGDVLASDRIENARRLRRLEHRRPQAYEGLAALWRFMGYVACEDLTRTRQALDEIERLAHRSHLWEPMASWGCAEYERIRGARETALVQVDHALSRMQPGQHLLWAAAATTRLLTLISLGRQAEAQRDGERYLALAGEVALDNSRASLQLATALAAAKQADAAGAWGYVSSAFELLAEHKAGGLRLGLAFEAAASVAIYLRDPQAFERYAPRCRELYCAHDNRTLTAKYERLMRAAVRAGLVAQTASLRARPTSSIGQTSLRLEAVLETCSDPRLAISQTLEIIVSEARARAGYVYTLVDDEPVLLAQLGDESPSDALAAAARTLLLAERDDDAMTQAAADAGADKPAIAIEAQDYRSLLVGHPGESGFVVHGLVMLVGADAFVEQTRQLAGRLGRYLESRPLRLGQEIEAVKARQRRSAGSS